MHNWTRLKFFLASGLIANFRHMLKSHRHKGNAKALLNANHKLEINNLPKLKKAVTKEIEHGFQFPFRPELMRKTPHDVVPPSTQLTRRPTTNSVTQ